jgi:exoribonuclease R
MIADGEIVNVSGRARRPARPHEPGGRPAVVQPVRLRLRRAARSAGTDKDVYVSAVNMKEALQGDRVVVRVERVTPKGPEGRIIRVLERRVSAGGRPLRAGRALRRGHVVAVDKRVLHELFFPAGQDGWGRQSGEDGQRPRSRRPPSAGRAEPRARRRLGAGAL